MSITKNNMVDVQTVQGDDPVLQAFMQQLSEQRLEDEQRLRAENILRGMVREIREGDFPNWALMNELQASENSMPSSDVRKDLVREVVDYIKGNNADDQRYMTDYDLARLDESDQAQASGLETRAEEAKRRFEELDEDDVEHRMTEEDLAKFDMKEKANKPQETKAEKARRKARDSGDKGLANYIEVRETEKKEEQGLAPKGSAASLIQSLHEQGEPIREPQGFERRAIDSMLASMFAGRGGAGGDF